MHEGRRHAADVTLGAVSEDEWRSLCEGFADMNYRQLWAFNVAAAARLGAHAEHVAILCDQVPVGLAAVRVKTLPVIGGGIAYVSGGPLTRRVEGGSDGAFALCLEALKDEYVRKRRLVLRVLGPVADEAVIQQQRQVLDQHGFTASAGAKKYRTIVVDIGRSDEAMLKEMHRPWRKNLSKALRSDVVVRQGTGPELFDSFQNLFDELRDNKGFDVDLPPQFYRAVQAHLPERSKFIVQLAESGGKLVAGSICSYLGDTGVYLFAAANDLGRHKLASYRLLYESLQLARRSKCGRYDLGGIDPAGNPGVFTFKKRMGGREVTVAGPAELSSGVRGGLALAAEQVYRGVSVFASRERPWADGR